MAEKLNAELDLLVREEGISDRQEGVVRIFQSAFTALSGNSSATLCGEAERAASGLRALIPPERITELADKPKQQLLGQFQDIWHGLIDIATRIPYQDNQSQTLVVKTLQVLRGDPSMWKDLPNLGVMMRDKWIGMSLALVNTFFFFLFFFLIILQDPTFEWYPEEDDNYTLSQWVNLNSFVARLFGSGVFIANRFPIWQLRQGLEDDLAEAKGDCSPAEAVDNRVAVASEWLTHAGPALVNQSLLESQDLDEGLQKSYRAGALFTGHPGFNIERWGFWKRRLGELRPTVGKEVALSVDRAIESMEASAVALTGN